MALESILFQQDTFSYYSMMAMEDHYSPDHDALNKIIEQGSNSSWDSPPPETGTAGSETAVGGCLQAIPSDVQEQRGRKRRRTKNSKNKEEMETQRMTHITVERNRRKQMNHYLSVLRSLMPPSYAQRGDQASIVGGAINFVKELEQLLQFMESHKQVNKHHANYNCCQSHIFNNFFTFPQYSTCPCRKIKDSFSSNDGMIEQRPVIADIEVTMTESQANIKVVSSKLPKQLIKMAIGFHSMSLTILHLNITTVDDLIFYTFSVKLEDDCQLTTANEIATAVHEIMGMIQEETISF